MACIDSVLETDLSRVGPSLFYVATIRWKINRRKKRAE